MPTTPTPGAVRAAVRIYDNSKISVPTMATMARIIDEETRAGELLAVLKSLVRMHDDACFICGVDDYEQANYYLKKAHSIIAAATK